MIVLDTDIVSLLSYGNKKVLRRLEAVSDSEHVAIAVITRMEVLEGRHAHLLKAANAFELAEATRRLVASEQILSKFAVLYPNDESGRHFEALLKPGRGRKKMRRADLLIASIVLAHDALLVTRNTRDFQGVPGLRLENWAD